MNKRKFFLYFKTIIPNNFYIHIFHSMLTKNSRKQPIFLAHELEYTLKQLQKYSFSRKAPYHALEYSIIYKIPFHSSKSVEQFARTLGGRIKKLSFEKTSLKVFGLISKDRAPACIAAARSEVVLGPLSTEIFGVDQQNFGIIFLNSFSIDLNKKKNF